MKPISLVCLLGVLLVACQQPNTSQSASDTSVSQPLAQQQQQTSPYTTLVLDSSQIIVPKWDYTASNHGKTYYFAPNGQYSDTALNLGFYRQILGTTSDGRMVAQDYYADTRKPQTSPFLIKPNGDPKVFDKSILDSRVIWYGHTDGQITSTVDFKQGVQQGWIDVYEAQQLVVQLKDNTAGIDIRFFVPSEKIWGEAQIAQAEKGLNITKLIFYYPTGQVMSTMDVDAQGQPSGMTTYDKQGNVLDDQQNATHNQLLLRRFAEVVHQLPRLMAR